MPEVVRPWSRRVPPEIQAAARRRVVSFAGASSAGSAASPKATWLAAPSSSAPAPATQRPVPAESVPDEPRADVPVADVPVADEPVSHEPVSDEPLPNNGSSTAPPAPVSHRCSASSPLSLAVAAVGDRIPPTLRGGRVALDVRAVAVLGLVGLLGVAFGASYLLRARPETVAPQRAVLVATPSPAVTHVVVDVEGKVRRPGVVRLAAGSRVVDALHAVGGAQPGAATTGLNLARVLVDGEQILVGRPQPGQSPGSPPSAGGASDAASTGGEGSSRGAASSDGVASAGGRVDLNAATLEQLDGLPGVGPVLAQRILDWRQEHGRFTSIEELQEVPGIGPAKFASIAKKVRV